MRFLRPRTGDSRRLAGVLAGATALLLASAALAAPFTADPVAKARLLEALRAGQSGEGPGFHTNPDGSLRYLSAPPGGYFAGASAAKSGGIEGAALAFVQEQAELFGVNQANVSFRVLDVQFYDGFNYVRLQQQYAGIDVLGAQIVVQLNGALGVPNVMSEVLTDTSSLEDGSVPLTPSIGAEDAVRCAIQKMAQLNPGLSFGDFQKTGEPTKVWYAPDLLDQKGGLRLAWMTGVTATGASEPVRETVLVDAANGGILLHYSQIPNLNNRRILDSKNSLYAWSEVERTVFFEGFCFLLEALDDPTSPLYQNYIRDMDVRSEGDPPCGVKDADDLYDILGGCYGYYQSEFGRDGWNGLGGMFLGVVRQPLNAGITSAWYDGVCPIVIGQFPEGMIADDVVGHEFQHGVTGTITDFMYFGESGALHEGYSDVFGEFIDWYMSDWGNDSPVDRWWMGEDIPFAVNGPIRYMKDPTVFGNPDRYNSPYWFDEVHTTSGVHNKLCYLLTDGDTFNGYTVRGMGEHRVAGLLYAALPMMTIAASYYDFAYALSAAAISLSWNFDDRLNLANAIRAVEIEPPSGGAAPGLGGLTNFRATPTRDNTGRPVIVLTWKNPTFFTFGDVRLQRSVVGFSETLDDTQLVANGKIEEYLDSDIQAGVEYFYTLIATLDTGLPQMAFARAVADTAAPVPLSEAFGFDPTTGNHGPFDLSFSQLLFTPVGPPLGPYGGTAAKGALGDYELTIKRPVTSLPTPKGPYAQEYSLAADGQISYTLWTDVFPFFGRPYSVFYIGSNGYISFVPLGAENPLNLPSLESHYTLPRISFLFDRLDAQNATSIWADYTGDRVAITFEHVRERGGSGTITVQTELFFSGHIRITYLEANVSNAIVGLSDGRGLLVNPADLFQSVEPVPVSGDLSSAPAAPSRLSIDPIAPQYANEGDTVTFEVTTSPSNLVPHLSAEWNGPGQPPFAAQPDGTGIFSWETTTNDAGTYRVRILAELNGAITYQDVQIVVQNVYALPTASEVGVATETPGDNPFASRSVPYGSAITAVYTYNHPELLTDPELYKEGNSIIYWYRNNEAAASFNNMRTISADQLFPGDTWYFEVIPQTVSGILGDAARSPSVYISGDPVIEEITPPYGLTSGGEIVRIRGRLFGFLRDGRVVGGTAKVLFGGVSAPSVLQISDQELEVITPVYAGHMAASDETGDLIDVVDVTVISSSGTGRLDNAFTYKAVKNGEPSATAPKERNILGCGRGADSSSSVLCDILLTVGCVIVLAAARRRSRA